MRDPPGCAGDGSGGGGEREAIHAEELERHMRHPDGWNLPVELDETRARVHRIADDQVDEAGRLSRQLVPVAGVLIDLGLPSIVDIPRLPKIAQDALLVVALVLKCLQEMLDSGAGPWD
jgi:hypothetical protein